MKINIQTPRITRYIKNTAMAAAISVLPLKPSAGSAMPLKLPVKNVATDIAGITNEINRKNSEIYKLLTYAAERKRIADSLRFQQPNLPRPSLKMNVATTKFKGNPAFLETFLKGVLRGKGQTFYNAQEKYGINASFLIGIANLESGYGKSAVAKRCNNIGGMRTSKGYIKYKSVDECIYAIASNLRKNYVNKGLKTLPQIGKKYCETQEWPVSVLSQMQNIHNASKCKIYVYN